MKDRVIPDGYKLTEVGVIPCDWEVKRLGDIVDIQMGQSPNSKYYNLQGLGVPLIQGNADIDNRKTVVRSYTKQITKTCDANDIIMTVRAPVGYVGIATCYSCIGRGVCSYKVHKADKKYTFYMLIFQERDWDNLGQGSTFTAVNSNEIYSFKIPLPPPTRTKKNRQSLKRYR
jgi:type I restriction enzyme S subunit